MKKTSNLLQILTAVIASIVPGLNPAVCQPVRVHPENPHYFEYKKKPAVFVTSAMHYAAVLNTAMDYDTYLELLAKYKFNHHREFVIACYSWHDENEWEQIQTPLTPRPGKLLSPYGRSDVKGAGDQGNKFDLNTWNPDYFKRLKDFCRKADSLRIVIEIVLFTVQYDQPEWETNPHNSINNINNAGNVRFNEYTFVNEKALLDRQKDLVRKIVSELNEFDNVYYEICNEPYWAKGIPEKNPDVKAQHFLTEVNEWQKQIAAVISDTEKELPKKHLIAQNLANTYYKIDTLCHSSVSVLNFHYAFPPDAVTDNYALDLPLSFDETADGCDAPYRRTEAWAFMMAGGAVYSNLDWSFANDDQMGAGRNPAGRRQSGFEVKQQLSVLKVFFDKFDYLHSKPVDRSRLQNIPGKILYYGLENQSETAIYFLKQSVVDLSQAKLSLPSGKYEIQWIDPMTGSVIGKKTTHTNDNHLFLSFPSFSDDLLLVIKKV